MHSQASPTIQPQSGIGFARFLILGIVSVLAMAPPATQAADSDTVNPPTAPVDRAAGSAAKSLSMTSGAVPVHRSNGQIVQQWDFGREDDRNYDGLPDGWQRKSGRGYPAYLKIAIRSEVTPLEIAAKRADAAIYRYWARSRERLGSVPNLLPCIPTSWCSLLRAGSSALPGLPPSLKDLVASDYLGIDVDGGAALLQSAPQRVSEMYNYVLEARVRTEGFQYDEAWVELAFLNEAGEILEIHETPRVTGTEGWQIGYTPAVPPPPKSTAAVARLRVEPTEQGSDIRGSAQFDRLRLRSYPQLQVAPLKPSGLYKVDEPIEVVASALGLRTQHAEISFELRDIDEEVLETFSASIETPTDASQEDELEKLAFGGNASWKIPSLEPGFYRLHARLQTAGRTSMQATTTVAVIEDLPGRGAQFGWTFPDGAPLADIRMLPAWLRDCRVGWVKYPCWLAPTDQQGADEIAWLFGRLQDSGIKVVGLLDQPPIGTAAEIDAEKTLPAVHVFRNIDVWQPLLEQLLNRLTMKVRRWQLGRERDFSFLARRNLSETIEKINSGLQGFGQPLDLAISWPWLEPKLADEKASWAAVVRSASEPLTAAELDAYLAMDREDAEFAPDQARGSLANSTEDRPATWLILDPLPSSQYDRATRIRDLIMRMATVRGHNVEAAFVSEPADPEIDLLTPEGTPGEMLLPWRTTAATLGTLKRIGSLNLPSGSENIVLSNGRRTVMVVWNQQPTDEVIFLGEEVQVLDVWGRRRPADTVVENGRRRQRISAGPVPVFVTGLHPEITEFRMNVALDRRSIDSLLGRSQIVRIEMENRTGQTLAGECQMITNKTWDVPRYPAAWQIAAGGRRDQAIPITLRSNATTGDQPIELEFKLDRFSNERFSVYRNLRVGPEGLDVQITTQLADNGTLLVRVEMVNSTERAQRYDCRLFPPGRQYERKTLVATPGERSKIEFSLVNGSELLGQTLLLRAAEQDGRRLLNYTIQANR